MAGSTDLSFPQSHRRYYQRRERTQRCRKIMICERDRQFIGAAREVLGLLSAHDQTALPIDPWKSICCL